MSTQNANGARGSTIDELLALDDAIAVAEGNALRALADHLREAAVNLPAGSKLARSFARHSLKFDQWAQVANRGHEAEMGNIELFMLEREVRPDEDAS